jgi:hypothetical protein
LNPEWPSSAEHRNEISIHQRKPHLISGGEDVPDLQYLPERFLSLAEGTLLSQEARK